MDGINTGDMVAVRPLVYGELAIQIELPRFDGEPLIYRAEPELEYDQFGRPLSAAVFGEEMKSHADTPAMKAGKAMPMCSCSCNYRCTADAFWALSGAFLCPLWA